MDNVTHSLIGITLGKTVSQGNKDFEKAAIWTAVIGNNIPDLDFILKPWVVSGNLGSILHHRGYTHTILFSVILGIVSAFLGDKIAKGDSKFGWKLVLIGIASVICHISFDFLNNYGVHPFSPFFNRWFYGDVLFIVEPLIWFSVLPLAFHIAKSKIGKVIPIILSIILLITAWTRIFNPLVIAMFLTVWALIFAYLQKFFNEKPYLALGGIAFILISFFTGSQITKSHINQLFLNLKINFQELSLISTPAPGNPFCWSIITVSAENQTDYVVRRGVHSLFPSLFDPKTCYLDLGPSKADYLQPTPINFQRRDFFWMGEFRRRSENLDILKASSCQFRAFLKFSRAPLWYKTEEGLVASDIRFEHSKGRGFTMVKLDDHQQECPTYPPPWEEPIQTFLHQNNSKFSQSELFSD